MARVEQNRALNDLLIDVCRSLLQYAVEAWPWSGPDTESGRNVVKQMAARQSAHASNLAELLLSRDWAVDFGTYPTEYTDLHYVSLAYFLTLLIENEQSLIGEIERTVAICRDDRQAASLLSKLLDDQREIVRSLKELQQKAPSGV